MEQRRKQTPGRFLRRHTPYFLLALTLVLLVAAGIFAAKIVRELRAPAQSGEAPSIQEPVSPAQTAQEQQPEQAQDPDASETQTAQETPAAAGTTVYLAGQRLRAVFDPEKLRMDSSEEGLDSFLPLTYGQLARIDVQKLNTARELLKTAELERICIGAIQAYYYTAPPTEDFVVTVLENSNMVYDAQLTAPAYGGAPELTARVRLLSLDSALWCLSAIYPAGEDCAALQQTFDSIAVRTEDTP